MKIKPVRLSLTFPPLKKGYFKERPNRFVGIIKYKGLNEEAHIHDPGRLTELLVKDAEVLFTYSRGKLKYYIKAVRAEEEWVLIDSAVHSKIAQELFEIMPELSSFKKIKKEVKLGQSRIDFTLDGIPLEVKGCTLVKEGRALFPDAPTIRGTRHVREIIKYEGMILFLIFRKAESFSPFQERDPEFSEALREARRKGIPILTAQLSFNGRHLYYHGSVPLADF